MTPAPPDLADLERHLVFAAWIVVRFGPVYAPVLERVEAEIEARKRADAPVDRARRLLAEAGLTSRSVPGLPARM